MVVLYEDNFGHWEIDCPKESAFLAHVQSQSVSAGTVRDSVREADFVTV